MNGRAGGGVPPWGRQSAARPGGARSRRVGHPVKVAKFLAEGACILLHIFSGGVFVPPYSPSRRAAHSAGPTQMNHPKRLFFDQIFNHFLTSIFDRFGVVLEGHLGVIFGTFGGQVGLPSAIW